MDRQQVSSRRGTRAARGARGTSRGAAKGSTRGAARGRGSSSVRRSARRDHIDEVRLTKVAVKMQRRGCTISKAVEM